MKMLNFFNKIFKQTTNTQTDIYCLYSFLYLCNLNKKKEFNILELLLFHSEFDILTKLLSLDYSIEAYHKPLIELIVYFLSITDEEENGKDNNISKRIINVRRYFKKN